MNDNDLLRMPAPGDFGLKIHSSNLVELTLITTKEPDPAPVLEWNFVTTNGALNLPESSDFQVTINDRPVGVAPIGFKRRPIYAPLKERDLRIGNHLYLQLNEPVADGETVRVLNPSGNLFAHGKEFIAVKHPFRRSPAIHINQTGYMPDLPKKATVGFYLGSGGELPITANTGFSIIDSSGSNAVFHGVLTPRPDSGYTYIPAPYQSVLEADFTAFQTPGEYWLQVPDLGVSFPFRIDNGAVASVARTYALGLYHQRCGSGNVFPFTRHTHSACHTNTAEVPVTSFTAVNAILAEQTTDYLNEPRHTAPRLNNVNSSLYPFNSVENIDVSGGHHDAGDYSKYTVNSAQFINALVFAVDTMPLVSAVDNLGLPESGDGISDLLQIAKWEADFLAKMQDSDGGFYFLVYPKNRRYEHDVLPDRGDSQVVFPKTTTATAAATAALAQIASSPSFQQHFPEEAALYLQKAKSGWNFLEEAITTYGRDGSYQKITHYGASFLHDDELAWAATELFLATGESRFHEQLLTHYDPSDPDTRFWSWWRLFEGYGCAVRSYAFSEISGRQLEQDLDPTFLVKSRAEILAGADDQLHFARSSAYGVSFPLETKAIRMAGWFFPINQAFDLIVGYQLDPKPEYLDAILSNINFECGNNPENVAFLTGIGRKRQREIVHQYAQNDRRILPPTGFPLGALQSGFPYLEHYKGELGSLTFPSDGDAISAYAPYDRWADCFNPTTEFVSAQQARALAVTTFIWANHSAANQPWQSAEADIVGLPAEISMNEEVVITLNSSEVNLNEAMITWEARGQEPFVGSDFTIKATNAGPHWVEAEAVLPDGRRVFATAHFVVHYDTQLPPNQYLSNAHPVIPEIAALYHLDVDTADATTKQLPLELFGDARFDDANLGWMAMRNGSCLRFEEIGDYATVAISNSTLTDPATETIVLEWMMYVNSYHSPDSNVPIATLTRNWNASLELLQNRYSGMTFRGGTQFQISGNSVSNAVPRNRWNHLRLAIGKSGYSVRINGELFAFTRSNEFANWVHPQNSSTLTVGNFEGWLDEIAIWNVKTNHTITLAAEPVGNESFTVNISGNPGVHYILEHSTNLLDWISISTNRFITNFSELSVSTDDQRRFFKATAIP